MTVFPNGAKERLHGHNYQMTLALKINDLTLKGLIPFQELKSVLKDVAEQWKEKVLIAGNNPFLQWHNNTGKNLNFTLCKKRYSLPKDEVVVLDLENIVVETLAEEIARHLYKKMKKLLEKHQVKGLELQLTEGPGQGARCILEW